MSCAVVLDQFCQNGSGFLCAIRQDHRIQKIAVESVVTDDLALSVLQSKTQCARLGNHDCDGLTVWTIFMVISGRLQIW